MGSLRALALAVVAILAALFGRAFFSARAELAEARAAEAGGDAAGALEHYQYALRWYTPGASAPVEAADALGRLADEAMARGDRVGALNALRRLRGGIRATRSFYVPFGDRQAAVDARIAELSAAEQIAAGLSRGQTEADLVAEHRRLLALDPTPNAALALLATAGFALWIGAGLHFIFRGLDAELRFVPGQAARSLGASALGFALYLIGLWLA